MRKNRKHNNNNMENAGTTKMQGSTQKWDKSGETSPKF